MDYDPYKFLKYLKDVPREETDRIGKSIDNELKEIQEESAIHQNLAYKEASNIVINS